MSTQTVRLLIACPDGRGIIAAAAGFLAEHGGNIVNADQHTDPAHGSFFMRAEIEVDGFTLDRTTFAAAWEPLATRYDMRWHVEWGDRRKRMAVLVSRETHCLNDILWRWKSGEIDVDLAFVAGNHRDAESEVTSFGVDYHYLPVSAETKPEQEAELLRLIGEAEVDFVVLARYMQVLSPSFVARFPQRIINIHHSFLPAFAGSKPYHQAFERGVKIIGATSHYVTDDLDDGPIIAQATLEVDHRDTVEDLVRKGRDLERIVLARAVRLHVQDKILVSNNKTVVFE